MSVISKSFYLDDVLTAMTTVKLSDPTGAYGVKRNDTDAVVVADATDMDVVSTGVYRYEFTDPAVGLTYTYCLEVVYGGETYWISGTFEGPVSSASTSILTGSEIRAEVAANLGRTDLTARIANWLKLAVEKVYSLVKFEGLESTAEFDTSADDGNYTIVDITDDSGYTIHQVMKLYFDTSDEGTPITLVSKSELFERFPYSSTETGEPTHAAIWGGVLYLRPIPNDTFTINLDTVVVPPTISDAGHFVVKGLDQALVALTTSIGYKSLGEEERAAFWDGEFNKDLAAGLSRDQRNIVRMMQPFELGPGGNDPQPWSEGYW